MGARIVDLLKLLLWLGTEVRENIEQDRGNEHRARRDFGRGRIWPHARADAGEFATLSIDTILKIRAFASSISLFRERVA